MALGSTLTRTALPFRAIPRREAENAIVALLMERGISTLVVGMPFNEDGSSNEACLRVEQFCRRVVRRLRARQTIDNAPKFRVIIVDEYASSATAREQLQSTGAGVSKGARLRMRKQGVVDCAAAALILQEYLDNPDPWPDMVIE